MDWKPISTAPKDREVTVWRTEDGPCTVHWFDKSSRFTESGITGWHLHDGHQWHVLQGHMPTHWTDLAPPSDKTDAAAAWDAALVENTRLTERLEDKTRSLRVEIAAKLGAYNEIKMLEASLSDLAHAASAVLEGPFGRENTEYADALFACLEAARDAARATLARGNVG